MNLNPRLVVEQYLPDLLKHNTGGLPIFKYLEVYEGELYDKVSEFAKNHTAIDSYLNSAYRSQKKSFRKQLDVKTVSAIIEMERTSENKPDSLYRKLCFLEIEEYDIDSLETLLKTDIGNNPRIFNDCPEIKRLIRIYDSLNTEAPRTPSPLVRTPRSSVGTLSPKPPSPLVRTPRSGGPFTAVSIPWCPGRLQKHKSFT